MINFIIINASDILLSILFNLLLANVTILLCFFFFISCCFFSFFIIPVEIKNVRLKLAHTNPTGAPRTVAIDV